MTTLYSVLGLPPAATDLAIKKRYHDLAWSKHPDRGGLADEFAKIAEAGRTLTDQELRSQYDAWLKVMKDPCPTCEGRGLRYISLSFTVSVTRRCDACSGEGWRDRL